MLVVWCLTPCLCLQAPAGDREAHDRPGGAGSARANAGVSRGGDQGKRTGAAWCSAPALAEPTAQSITLAQSHHHLQVAVLAPPTLRPVSLTPTCSCTLSHTHTHTLTLVTPLPLAPGPVAAYDQGYGVHHQRLLLTQLQGDRLCGRGAAARGPGRLRQVRHRDPVSGRQHCLGGRESRLVPKCVPRMLTCRAMGSSARRSSGLIAFYA